jgi:hypothetical protein
MVVASIEEKTMKQSLTMPLAVALSVLLSAPMTSIRAQTTPATPQSEQDSGGMPMMGGGDMGRMMSMMHGGGMMGGMPFEHVEGRLAFLKTELNITPAQEPQWNKFADAARSVAQSAKAMHEQMMQGGRMMQGGVQPAPVRLDRYERMLNMRLEAVRTIRAAFDPLYASLSDEQKKTADELFGRMAVM